MYRRIETALSNGSFKQLHVKSKTVPVYACPFQCQLPICFSYISHDLLDLYISKLPPKAVENDIFYVRPLDDVPDNPSAPWYSVTPVGKHTLNDKVKKMCNMAGLSGNKTNHSLRATGATHMYESGVPEKLIQERTGHRSLEALRSYERSNADQHQTVSAILSAPQQQMYRHTTETRSLFHSMQSSIELEPSHNLPGVSFQNLHGCTINIHNQPQPPSSTHMTQSQLINMSDSELDSILAEINDIQPLPELTIKLPPSAWTCCLHLKLQQLHYSYYIILIIALYICMWQQL